MPVSSNNKNINTNRYSYVNSNPTTNVNRNSVASVNTNANTSTNTIQPKPIIKKNSPVMNSVTVTTTKPKSALKNINRNSVNVANTTKKVIKINTNRNSVPILTSTKPIIKKGNTKNTNGNNSNPSSPSNSIKSNSTNSSRGNINSQKTKPIIKSKSSMNALSAVIPNDFVSPLTPYSYTPYTPYFTPNLNENGDDITVPQYDDNSIIVPPNVNDSINNANTKIISKGTKNINRLQKSDIKKEGKNDAVLREINRNGSRTISKRTSGHENNTSFSKIKRRSIFTRIF